MDWSLGWSVTLLVGSSGQYHMSLPHWYLLKDNIGVQYLHLSWQKQLWKQISFLSLPTERSLAELAGFNPWMFTRQSYFIFSWLNFNIQYQPIQYRYDWRWSSFILFNAAYFYQVEPCNHLMWTNSVGIVWTEKWCKWKWKKTFSLFNRTKVANHHLNLLWGKLKSEKG